MNSEQLSDEAIIERILQEDESKLFGLLYQRYQKKVYNKCYSLVRNKSAAEELSQDIFLRVLLSLKSFENKSSFSTWLYSVTYRHCIEYFRKAKNHRSFPIDDEINISDDPDDVEDDEILSIKSERLNQIVEMLHPIDKAVLLMKYKDGMKLKAIQTALNISESSTKMKIKRAKLKVLKLYQKHYSR